MDNRDTAIRRLTKAEILGGRAAIEYVSIAALDAEVPIRRLSSRQKAEVEAAMARGIGINIARMSSDISGTEVADAMARGAQPEGVDVSIDLPAMTLAGAEAQALAVHYGLAYETPVTLDDVEAIDPLAVQEIASHVYRISGIKQEDLNRIAAFRGQ